MSTDKEELRQKVEESGEKLQNAENALIATIYRKGEMELIDDNPSFRTLPDRIEEIEDEEVGDELMELFDDLDEAKYQYQNLLLMARSAGYDMGELTDGD